MSLKRAALAVLALAPALALSACAPAPVEVDLRFPSLGSAMFADRARLYAFPLGPDDLGRCPELLEDVLAGTDPSIMNTYASGLVRVCSFPGMELPALEGPHAWLAEVRDMSERRIFAGCTVAEIAGGTTLIQIDLAPTAALDPSETPTGSAHECIGGSTP